MYNKLALSLARIYFYYSNYLFNIFILGLTHIIQSYSIHTNIHTKKYCRTIFYNAIQYVNDINSNFQFSIATCTVYTAGAVSIATTHRKRSGIKIEISPLTNMIETSDFFLYTHICSSYVSERRRSEIFNRFLDM